MSEERELSHQEKKKRQENEKLEESKAFLAKHGIFLTVAPGRHHTDKVLSQLETFDVCDVKERTDFDPTKQLVKDAALAGVLAYKFPDPNTKPEQGKGKIKL